MSQAIKANFSAQQIHIIAKALRARVIAKGLQNYQPIYNGNEDDELMILASMLADTAKELDAGTYDFNITQGYCL